MICTALSKVDTLSDGTDVVRVCIDNEVEALMFYDYAESLKFLNEEVVVSYRQDIYEGKIQTFINTLTIPVKISTLDKDKGVRLFTEQNDNNSNVCFADMLEGDHMNSAIMYCVSCAYESSPKATWVSMKVRDKAGRIRTLRLFDYDRNDVNYSGEYIKCDIKNTKYGLVTDYIKPMNFDFAPNPEIDICRHYIERYFAADTSFTSVVQSKRLLDFMNSYIAEERGYLIVRTAIELDILSGLKNVFNEVDFTAVSYAIVLSKGYAVKEGASGYSDRFKNYMVTLESNIPNSIKKKVLLILDNEAEETSERRVFTQVVNLADTVVSIKKE